MKSDMTTSISAESAASKFGTMAQKAMANFNLSGHTPSRTKPVTVRFQNREVVIGGREIVVIAGPCSIESEEHLSDTARSVAQRGATILRGGVFKMRTSPNSFQGIGTPAFEFLNRVKAESGLPMVSEVTDPRQIEAMLDSVDMFQVGSRNMYNYELLKELGRLNRPVILKRAFAATIEEWARAAEYIVKGGNDQVVLCERGIRTFETATRNTLDLNAVAWIKAHTDFAIIVDPSHGTGRRELVTPMALAGIAAGADGVICEVHPRPDEALSDSFQALDYDAFDSLVRQTAAVAEAVHRPLFQFAPQFQSPLDTSSTESSNGVYL
ncbi:MAG: 3-deoxy-7-phosphoheptulonate synthase [Bdellovibrionales bacterium]|jgi:3-deoxy-7-phosphoheptulonate synthase|nr:3-deoxy-7-phosphoheptulonate synthase [Bdellovibrionales bacterium]